MLRLAVRSPGRLQVTSTPRVCSRGVASASVTSKVWGQVALGVAHVATVEPHVTLVEESFEAQPPAFVTIGGAVVLKLGAVEERAVLVGKRLVGAPMARHW